MGILSESVIYDVVGAIFCLLFLRIHWIDLLSSSIFSSSCFKTHNYPLGIVCPSHTIYLSSSYSVQLPWLTQQSLPDLSSLSDISLGQHPWLASKGCSLCNWQLSWVENTTSKQVSRWLALGLSIMTGQFCFGKCDFISMWLV